MEQHKIRRFRDLDGTDQNKIMELLRCAALDPLGHKIYTEKSGVRTRPYGLRIEVSDPRARCGPITSEHDLVRQLWNIEFVTHGEEPWESLRFLPEVIAWYRETHPISDTGILELVGRHFYSLALTGDEHETYDPEAIAEAVGLSAEQVDRAVRALEGAEILFDVCSGTRGASKCFALSKPKGFSWAVSDFKVNPGAIPHVAVNVAVIVDLHSLIEAIREIDAAPEKKRFYELSIRKLEEELNEGHTTWDTVKDALSTASAVKEVAVPIIAALNSHMDQVLGAISQVGFG